MDVLAQQPIPDPVFAVQRDGLEAFDRHGPKKDSDMVAAVAVATRE
jgi:hypothetical protein